jgi:hypothetical protein
VEFTEKDKNGAVYTCCFENGAEFGELNAGISELRLFDPAHPKGHEHPSAFTADMAISKKFRPILCKAGRNRWKIEKGGFNSQKTEAAMLCAFSRTLRTQRAHYLPFQIGRAICQLLLSARSLLKELELSQKALFHRLPGEILGAALSKRRIKRVYSQPETFAFANSNYNEPGLDPGAENSGKAA